MGIKVFGISLPYRMISFPSFEAGTVSFFLSETVSPSFPVSPVSLPPLPVPPALCSQTRPGLGEARRGWAGPDWALNRAKSGLAANRGFRGQSKGQDVACM